MRLPFRSPAVSGIVVGVRDQAELLANIEAFDRPIPPELWTALDRAGLLPGGDQTATTRRAFGARERSRSVR